jgi:hypothetical protein
MRELPEKTDADAERCWGAAAKKGSHWIAAKNIAQGLNRLRRNSVSIKFGHRDKPAGAEARLVLLALSARLKSCPDTKPARIEFFRNL